MKKSIKLGVLIALCSFTNTTNLSAQVSQKGDKIIDVYYGFPNLYSAVFKMAHAETGSELNVDFGGIGPIGGRFEYLVTDRIGLGLDIGFNSSTINFSKSGFNQLMEPVIYDYAYSTQKLGVMATLNYHFLKNSEKFDLYGILGIGYGNRTFELTSTDPNYVTESYDTPLPIAARLGIGMRYMFTDNLGANLSLGAGQGGLVNGGLSYKF